MSSQDEGEREEDNESRTHIGEATILSQCGGHRIVKKGATQKSGMDRGVRRRRSGGIVLRGAGICGGAGPYPGLRSGRAQHHSQMGHARFYRGHERRDPVGVHDHSAAAGGDPGLEALRRRQAAGGRAARHHGAGRPAFRPGAQVRIPAAPPPGVFRNGATRDVQFSERTYGQQLLLLRGAGRHSRGWRGLAPAQDPDLDGGGDGHPGGWGFHASTWESIIRPTCWAVTRWRLSG